MIFGCCLAEGRENPIQGQPGVVAKPPGTLPAQPEGKMPLRIFPSWFVISKI